MGGILTGLIASFVSKATRALFAGGAGATSQAPASIDYLTIETTGNATNFGNLTLARKEFAAGASSTRGVFFAGRNQIAGVGDPQYTTIDYVTIASAGNATSFGNLPTSRFDHGGCSSSTRGLFAGGYDGGDTATIGYVTIASTGNSTSFGNLVSARRGLAGCASTTRGIFTGGFFNLTTIEYVTIATTGNSTSFGALTQGRSYLAACSSDTRGVIAGGYNYNPNDGTIPVATIDYITIATTGNATSFGSLTVARARPTGAASLLRGIFAGGQTNTGAAANNINYITIATTGNGTNFGNLTVVRDGTAGLSNGHGGISA